MSIMSDVTLGGRRVDRRTPTSVERGLRDMGDHLATWRKLQRVPAVTLAARAGISRHTLYEIERGSGKASSENLLRVLDVLGILGPMVSAADPYTTDVGKLRTDEILPQRIRRQ